MLVMVDTIESEPTQWGYTNQDNEIETVTIFLDDTSSAMISMCDEKEVYVYTKDIPNLIKALQAAYYSMSK